MRSDRRVLAVDAQDRHVEVGPAVAEQAPGGAGRGQRVQIERRRSAPPRRSRGACSTISPSPSVMNELP